jgi:hypothetical protein
MTTQTATLTTGAELAPPPFARQAAGESTADYGRRAMFYALQLAPWFAPLDDAGLEAGSDAVTEAVTAKGISETTLRQLNSLQQSLRRQLAGRQRDRAERDRRLQELFDLAAGAQGAAVDVDAQAGSQGPAAGSQGGGGSKVPRAPRPKGQGPAGGLQAMDETGAGAFRRAVFQVPAASLADGDAF